MSAISHLVARQFTTDSGTGGISALAIGLIVGVGIVPALILIYVVSWLFWCYPYNRTCCCTRRKKKTPDEEVANPLDGVVSSGETMHEKRVEASQRPEYGYRTESGNSYVARGGSRLSKPDPRMSLQTVDSGYTGRVTQEPKPFV